ncbi:hypothetical protein CFAM422_011160 [Trichoderma lentiforme]|uniref:Uncharacterized protein n=1 Tax=Trichoderma lentiforme TaxID=1567552 RepID=A0A9P4X4M9_9HYPO|nr:hypothetical protein CFAM422_011160 [Trichoderma lentiforme]
MDRARRATNNRRKPLGVSASPPSTSDASFERHQSSASPIMAHATNTPQGAPQGRRANKSLQPAFTFSTPGPTRPSNLRKRSKTMDDYAVADDDYENESPKKGGHSLRKRARVDYTFEQIDDDADFSNPVSASTSASARNKKRRPDSSSYDSEDLYGSGLKRRGASVDADTPSSRRRNPSRKMSEARAYKDDVEDDENDVQDTVHDTIEVGVLYSDSEKSDSAHMDHSNASSTDLSVGPQKSTPIHSGQDSSFSHAGLAEQPLEAEQRLNHAESAEEAIVSVASPTEITEFSDIKPEGESHSQSHSEAGRARLHSPHDTTAPASNAPETAAEPQLKIQQAHDATLDTATQDGAQPSPPNNNKNADDNNLDQSAEKHEQDSQPRQSPSQSSPPPPASRAAEVTPAEDTVSVKPPLQLPEKEILQDSLEETRDSNMDAQSESKPQPPSQELPYYPSAAAHLFTVSAPLVQQPEPQAQETPKQQSPEPESKASSPPPPAAISATVASTPASPSTSAFDSTILEDSQVTSVDVKSVELPAPMPEDDASVAPALPEIHVQEVQVKPTAQITSTQSSERGLFKPQPRPVGRWAHLTPYIDGEYVSYPERKAQQEDEVATSEEQTADDRETNDMEPMVDDNDDATGIEAPTPALNTPLRGSPAPDSIDPTASNSPAAGGDDGDDVDVSEEPTERSRSFRYRKLRNPEEYLSAIENYEDMSTAELFEVLESINVSLFQWQTEWTGLGKIVDDYENSLRRRVADIKYESRTRNFHQHGVNYEEPEFVVKGYRSKDREGMTETRYLQNQDRIMAAAYGFEYDPHPSKIGRQNPETQQAGIMTRGRSLRNQPKPTAKATEADEVTGKRQRKPVQLFDPATQDISRSSTPVPTGRPRRRKTANGDNDDGQYGFGASFNSEPILSDEEAGETKRRRNRTTRPKMNVPSIVEELVSTPISEEPSVRDTPRSGRKARVKQPIKYDEESLGYQFVEEEPQMEEKPPRRRHLLTLKIPKGKNISEPSSEITDNGDSRPSTADSDSTSHTAESSYSFRPKRQKRFRDDAEESEEAAQAPIKKRNKRTSGGAPLGVEDDFAPTEMLDPDTLAGVNNRKIQKIKVVRNTPASRKGTPSSLPNGEEAEEPQKDYKSMTKSEKMSASMKSRWANGNMAGAVEKRKATLAAKKAAQAAAEQRVGLIAPKPKVKSAKKEPVEQTPMPPPFNPQQPQQHMHGMGYPYPSS